jgi:ribosomal protein S18 acetylase RimI-like enzyme
MLVTFRPCGPKDHAILLKFVIEYYRFDKIPFNRQSLSKGLDTLLRNLSQGQAWLMESHKKPVGYAVLTYNFDLEYGGVEGMLTDLYVSKRYRNQGIGSLALYEIEDFCRERGIPNIELQLMPHNRHAEEFYRKAGFQTLKRRVMLLGVRTERATRAPHALANASAQASAGKRR